MKIYIVFIDVVNDVAYSIHMWSYDFYDMMLSTGKHMIQASQ